MTKDKLTKEDILGHEPNRLLVITATVGLLIIVIATMIPLLHHGFDLMWYRYLYAAGAVMVLVARLFTPYTGKVQRLKRLHRMESWSGIFFCVAAFFMFYDKTQNRDWLAFTLAGGAIQILATFLITKVARKHLNQQ